MAARATAQPPDRGPVTPTVNATPLMKPYREPDTAAQATLHNLSSSPQSRGPRGQTENRGARSQSSWPLCACFVLPLQRGNDRRHPPREAKWCQAPPTTHTRAVPRVRELHFLPARRCRADFEAITRPPDARVGHQAHLRWPTALISLCCHPGKADANLGGRALCLEAAQVSKWRREGRRCPAEGAVSAKAGRVGGAAVESAGGPADKRLPTTA